MIPIESDTDLGSGLGLDSALTASSRSTAVDMSLLASSSSPPERLWKNSKRGLSLVNASLMSRTAIVYKEMQHFYGPISGSSIIPFSSSNP